MEINPLNLHIFFVQFPVVLSIFGLIMFILGIIRRASVMLETAFYSLVAVAVSSMFAFLSGRYLSSSETSSLLPAPGHKHVASLSVLLAMIIGILVLWLRYLPVRRERVLVLLGLTLLSLLLLLTEMLGLANLG